MKKLLFILIISAQTFAGPITVDSEHNSTVHHAAHFGSSYAISMFSYGFFKKAFNMPPFTAFMFSALLTTSIGFSYKFMEGSGPVTGLGPAVLYNSLGILGTGLTIKLFEF